MDRRLLKDLIAEGLSLSAIGRRVGRDASTVSYWCRKHGLEPVGARRHAARGGIRRDVLAARVDAGHSIDRIARDLAVSASTVRHWLRVHGLQTARGRRLAETQAARTAGVQEIEHPCPRHGNTRFVLEARGSYRCFRCRSEAVVERRRAIKQQLVKEAGGRCRLCGYDRYIGALQFHHLKPAEKAFSLSHEGITRSLERARAEAQKCIVLCACCHAEVEAGIVQISPYNAPVGPG